MTTAKGRPVDPMGRQSVIPHSPMLPRAVPFKSKCRCAQRYAEAGSSGGMCDWCEDNPEVDDDDER